MWYHVAEPNSYLVITGVGIDTVRIAKKAFVYPFQKVTKISVTPFDFSMQMQAMTIEKLKFSLPAVFTIGPADEGDSLRKYAVFLTGESDGQPIATNNKDIIGASNNHVQAIVKGIIEGETRSIVSNMTMEELFRDRRKFKQDVLKHIQEELNQFGLKIYNANVKELQDTPGSEYFAFLSRKAHEGALNQTKVDVADARMKGEVGEAEKQGLTKQSIAKIHAATAVLETERKKEKATADAALTSTEISIENELNLARIQAKRDAEKRDTELQKVVEQKRAEMELERLRATKVTQARIDKESSQQKADAEAYKIVKESDASYYAREKDIQACKLSRERDAEVAYFASIKEADAAFNTRGKEADADFVKRTRAAEALLQVQEKETHAAFIKKTKDADADLIARTKKAEALFLERSREAEAHLIGKQKEAQGLLEMAKAYGTLSEVLGGPQGLMQYMMLQNNTYEKLALANAQGINGLQPKISVWTTGNQGEGSDPTAPIRNLFQSLPPLLSTINDQTGMAPPSWLAQLPQADGQHNQQMVKKNDKLTNGIGH